MGSGPPVAPLLISACTLTCSPVCEDYPLACASRLSLVQVENSGIIRIHVCEGGIRKSLPRITDWDHEACLVMTNCDHAGRIFLSHPHTNNGLFLLLTTKYLILYWKKHEKDEYTDVLHGDVILTLQ